MDNIYIANIFHEIADILELKGEDSFRIGAYRNAARTIESLPQNIEDIAKKGKLEEIPGIGASIAEKINELLKTQKLTYLDELRKTISPGLVVMLNIPGLGPKTILKLHKEFGVETIEDLERLLPLHKICKLEGFGEKSEENIKKGLEQFEKHRKRALLGKVYPQAQAIVDILKRIEGVDKVSLAGSIRRMKETIGDIDILCTCLNAKKVIDTFCSMPQVKEVKARGTTKAVVILKTGIEADLRVVEPRAYGAALHYFTGNKAHNIKIRTLGVKRGLKINEYGIFKKDTTKRIGGETEQEVFEAVGLPYIEPELREDRGEIEAAFKNKLPRLIKLSDIKGDLHVHTTYSDGHQTVLQMAEEAIKRGYQYIAITDHTTTVGITHGMDGGKIQKQMREIEAINREFKAKNLKFRILKGVECDIKADGTLDLPDEILEKLDVVVASIHSKFGMDQTERLIKACQNPNVDIIAHPTGRKLGERDPYPVDLDKVMQVCKQTNTYLELNSFWDRLDLNDVNCKKAKEKGVKIVISTDTHHLMELDIIKFGIATARRGWIAKDDVINTQPLNYLQSLFNSQGN